MHNGAEESKIQEYTLDDLPRFFKDRSKAISKKFSDRRVKISTIRSKKIGDNGDNNEFSFELKLFRQKGRSESYLHSKIFLKTQELISLFKSCLNENKIFTKYIINVEGEELVIINGFGARLWSMVQSEKNKPILDILDKVGKHVLGDPKYDVREFNRLPQEKQSKVIDVFSQGITVKLQASIEDINLSKLNQIDLHLSGKEVEEHVATENNEQDKAAARQTEESEDTNEKEQTELMEKEISQGTNGELISDERVEQSENKKELNKTEPVKKETKQKKQIVLTRGKFGFDITSRTLPYPPVSKPVTVTEKKDSDANLNTSNEVNSSEEKENHNTESEHIKVEPIPKQQVKKSTETSSDNGAEIKGIIKRAQGYAKTEIILSENESREKPKTFDEIFYETVIAHYCPECPETFTTITESVFEAVFLQDIPEKGKRLEEDVLNVLKKFGLEFNRSDLIKLVDGEKLNLQHFNKHSVLYKEKSAIRKLYDEFRSYATIYIAQKKARKAIKNNNDKTRDAILTELIQEYSNQDSSTFTNVVDVVLYEVFCNGKDPNQIETLEEVFYALRALEVQFNEEYLESRMRNKKDLLYALVREQIYIHEQYKKDPATSLYQYIYIKPTDHSSENEAKTSSATVSLPTDPNTRLESRSKVRRKLMLENIFYSPETYFCLFSIVAFIATLYLWHFPPIWMAVLKELMPPQKREEIGSVLNIGLPILIVLCIANLVHFIYSEYSGYVKFVEQENARNLQPSLEL